MIPAVLGAVFVIACVVWGASWIIQILAVVVVVAWRLLALILYAVVTLLGGVAWCVMFCFRPRYMLAQLRAQRAAATATPDQPWGARPFRRDRNG